MTRKTSGSNFGLPAFVMSLLLNEGAWLVGSAVTWVQDNCDPRYAPKDIDLIIPPENWSRVARMLHDKSPVFNTYGGVNIVTEGWSIDLWPQTLSGYFRQGGVKTPRLALSMDPYIILNRVN